MSQKDRFRKQALLRYVLPVCALFLTLSTAVWAQSGSGAISGTVHDPTGAVVANATVTSVESATNTTYTTVTTDNGRFNFPEVKVGTYTVTVSAAGFKEEIQSGITVSVASTATLNIGVQVGQTSQSVTVNANAEQLQTESSDVGTTVTPALIQQLPLNFSGLIRSPLAFMILTPGFQGDATGNPQSQSSFKLNGGGTAGADILLDGASIQYVSPDYQMNFGISTDAVDEFNTLTSTFDAEYGRTSGGLVIMASKSGTNSFHGGVYDLLKNKVLDANSWQNNHLGNAKPNDTQNDYGAFGGGPAYIPKIYDGRGKTFWFFSYEAFRFKSGGPTTTSVPTPQMWGNGDFSQLLNGGQPLNVDGVIYAPKQLYDYTTCSGVNLGNPCQPFVNNQIPISRLDTFAKNYIPLLPTAGITTQPYLNSTAIYSTPINNDLFSIRIDQNIRQRHKVYGSYAWADMPIVASSTYGPLYTESFGSTFTHYIRLAEDWTITPRILNHLNAGFSRRWRIEVSQNTLGQWDNKLDYHGNLVDEILPFVDIQYDPHSLSTDFQSPGFMPSPPLSDSSFADNSFQYDDGLAWTRGDHNLKFGIQYRRQELNQKGVGGSSGSYDNPITSAGDNAQGAVIDPNSGSGVASFFLGAPSTWGIGGPPANTGFRVHYWGFYAQDDWKATPKLTLNLGFRYEIPEPAFEVHGLTSQVNPTLPNPAAGGLPGALEFQGTGTGRDGKKTPMNSFWGSWGPRAGLAYQVDPNTVVRLAYGIYYTPMKISNFGNTDSQGFVAVGVTYPQNPNVNTPAVIPSSLTMFPGNPNPNISPSAANTTSPTFLPNRLARPGQVQNWTVDIQRQLPGQWLVDMAYVGNHGAHLQARLADPNVGPLAGLAYGDCNSVLVTNQASSPACAGLPPVPIPYPSFVTDWGGAATVAQALRPFPQYGNASLDTAFSAAAYGDYTYEAAQIQFTKRYGSGLTVLGNYTWSKNLTDSDSDYAPQAAWNGGNDGLLNPYNTKAEKSYSEFDQPQIFKIAYTYELPFGQKRKYLANSGKAVDLVAGGWFLGGLDQYATGFPLYVTENGWTNGIFAGQATGGTPRPNVVLNTNMNAYHGGTFVFGQTPRINPAAFTQSPNYTFGDSPRLLGNVRYFAHYKEDLQAGKRIPLWTERVALNFRFDAFNLFNRHGWGCFNNVVGAPGFGTATCGTGPNAEVNNNVAAPASRTLQANFRITF